MVLVCKSDQVLEKIGLLDPYAIQVLRDLGRGLSAALVFAEEGEPVELRRLSRVFKKLRTACGAVLHDPQKDRRLNLHSPRRTYSEALRALGGARNQPRSGSGTRR